MKFRKVLAAVTALAISASICAQQVLAAEFPSPEYYGSNYGDNNYGGYASDTVKSYLTELDDGSIMRFQASDSEKDYLIEYYSSSYEFTENKIIPAELPIYGGFYASENNYYILTGQNNPDESDEVEVFRITKYDTDWNKIDSIGLYGANTTIPFRSGSARMADDGKYLYIRTSHQMYKSTNDGLNHQANVTIKVDMEEMEITYAGYLVSYTSIGYISHSFNQFIRMDDDGTFATIDHGDAYPRSVALYTYATEAVTEWKTYEGGTTISDSDWWNEKSVSMDDLIGDIIPDSIFYVAVTAGDHDIYFGYNATEPIYDVDEDNPYWNQVTIYAGSSWYFDDIDFNSDNVMIYISADDGVEYDVSWEVYGEAVVIDEKTGEAEERTYVSDTKTMLDIFGPIGENYTGVQVGGFEISDTAYIVAGASVIQDANYMDYNTNNIFVSVWEKDSEDDAVVTWITDYAEGKGTVSNPHLTKISNDRFLLSWEKDELVYYTELDGNGKQVSDIYNFEAYLSDCAPIVANGEIVWYVWQNSSWTYSVGESYIIFYTIDTDDISQNDRYVYVSEKANDPSDSNGSGTGNGNGSGTDNGSGSGTDNGSGSGTDNGSSSDTDNGSGSGVDNGNDSGIDNGSGSGIDNGNGSSTNNGESGNNNKNPNTGSTLPIIPAIAAAASVIISKKRK